jgi:SH3-like domain-containing protein
MGGQGDPQQLMPAERRLLKSAALGLLAAVALFSAAQAAGKFDKVNARAGPGDDHKLLFVYRVRGLPLQVIAETSEWRRVCDPEGTLAWVHKRVTDGRRTTINTADQPVALLKRPKDDARANAYLNAHALATLDHCDKGWCKVTADHASGWVREGTLWGTTDGPQCH